MVTKYASVKAPCLLGIRYKTIFIILQIVNAIRYYIRPEEFDARSSWKHITVICVAFPSACAFLHGSIGNEKNWEWAQHFLVGAGGVYMLNIIISNVSFIFTPENDPIRLEYLRDQGIYWLETHITIAMWFIARAEIRYYSSIEYLNKMNEEYVSLHPKKVNKRQRKAEENSDKEKPKKQSWFERIFGI
ncbi:hypothetical protein GCK72_010781 [Caenorhabditis remanei]|uniref:Transmembrane protein n=1 Tax=Caenorhabditis remanei TaxID=31234 RepID=A0A6A5H644_CAERE|nr:hypothetical protein GCK72_010781 [Caenorhabditis remanei]KAF1762519.1 hypothetical protein GCK72_010781 [Caenorhabditis remanei]